MMLRRVGPLFLLCLVLGWPASAQTRGAQPGTTVDLRVRLSYSNGRPVDRRLRVQLLDAFESYMGEAYCDDQGQAVFPRLQPGSYRLRVSGMNVEETTSPTFTLGRNEGQHFESVDVKMKAEAEADTATPSAPGGAVAAVDLSVPDKARKEFEKGNAALQKNDLATARKALEKAIQIYPQYAAAYNNLGILAMKTGDRAAAQAAFQQAIRINDHYPRACTNLARLLLADRNYAEAEGLLNRALTTDPLNPEALTMLANVQLQTGRFDQAINTAWKVHSVPHDGFSVVHIVAALAFEARHMPEDAAVEYATYLKESPNGPEAPRASAALAALQSKGP
jgi:tetratricopeptide (TPR) repeat protein